MTYSGASGGPSAYPLVDWVDGGKKINRVRPGPLDETGRERRSRAPRTGWRAGNRDGGRAPTHRERGPADRRLPVPLRLRAQLPDRPPRAPRVDVRPASAQPQPVSGDAPPPGGQLPG